MNELIGKTFSRLTVISETDPLIKKRGTRDNRVLCRCSCGNEVKVITYNLKNGNTKSCGCLKKELISKRSKTHGMSHTSIFNVFSLMKSRCYNENNSAYKNYGGRGITICDEWLNDPSAFFSWASENGYSQSLQIDRIDNDKGYSPENCRFVTLLENIANRRFMQRNNTSGYRGVSLHIARTSHNKWLAKVKQKTIGYFSSPEEAAKARDKYIIDNNIDLPLNFTT